MHRRAVAVAIAFALTLGGGVAVAGTARPATAPATAPVTSTARADFPVTPARLRRADLRSKAAFSRAYQGLLAARTVRLSQADQGIFLYAGSAEAVPIHDVDGDHADDVLEIRGTAVKGPTVAVRSGRTGREKWVVTAGAMHAVQYVPVPGGRPLVLTYSNTEQGEDAFLAYAGTETFSVQALDAATGAPVWSADWTGVVSFTPAAVTVTGMAMPGGILTTRPGGHPTLLIDSFDEVYTDASDTLRGHLEYVDVVTGTSTGATRDADGAVSFNPVGDLDADGTDDVVEVAEAGTITALSGADAHVLWTVQPASAFDYGWATRSDDMTGDRRPDVLVWTGTFDGATGSVAGLDGRTGRQLWQRAASGAHSLGDIDRDGRSDTRLLTYLGSSIRYTAVTSSGRTLWSTTVTSSVARTSPVSWLAGDLDGDGILDSYVRLVDRSEPGSSIGKRSFVVDGRTGRLAEHVDWGIPLGDSLDGRGDDFARIATVLVNGAQRVIMTAVDGRSGRPAWSRQLPVDSSAGLADVWAGNFSGTGRMDLLGILTEPDHAVVVAQQGRSGRTSWSGGYDTRAGGKPDF